MKISTTPRPRVLDDTDTDVVRLVSGEGTVIAVGRDADSEQPGTYEDLTAEVYALVHKHEGRDALLVETANSTRIYPASHWPVLTVSRGALFDR